MRWRQLWPSEFEMVVFSFGMGAFLRNLGLFEERFGVSPKNFRTQYRMRLAQDLLRLRDLSVHETATQLGYGHAAHFSIAFKKHFGQSPNMWKQQVSTEQG